MRALFAQIEMEHSVFEEMSKRWSKQRWWKYNDKALTQIHLHLSNEILYDVHHETSANNLCM